MVAGMLGHIYLDVVNSRLIDIGSGGSGDECGCGSGWHRVRRNGVNQIMLQLDRLGSGLHDNARQAHARQQWVGKIVVLEAFNLKLVTL